MTMDFADRIVFDRKNEIMEVDFSHVTFEHSQQVDEIYDQIAKCLEQTGCQWYFLVNYKDCRIYLEARLAWQNRGKKLNTAYSLGSVRYQVSQATSEELVQRAKQDRFYANQVDTREQGLKVIDGMKLEAIKTDQREQVAKESALATAQWAQMAHDETIPTHVLASRISFLESTLTMEVDFSEFDFVNEYVVDAFYDYIEGRLRETNQQWYFLVNYRNCKVQPKAWSEYAKRGKALNLEFSLGSVRFDASPQTADEIKQHANTESFDPNLFSNRDDAVQRIAAMKKNS